MELNKSLFQISSELMQIWNELKETGGELTPEIEAALTLTNQQLQTKAGNYVSFIKKLESETEHLKETYLKKVQSEIKKRENLISHLKDALLVAVQEFGDIETDRLFKVCLRQSEAVNIYDIDKLPNDYKIFEPKADKRKIKDSIKAGEDVKGAEIIINNSINIR